MDTRDGRIYRANGLDEFDPEDRPYMKPMEVPPTPLQRAKMKVGRNDNCPCGSGKKFKRCCMMKIARCETSLDELEAQATERTLG